MQASVGRLWTAPRRWSVLLALLCVIGSRAGAQGLAGAIVGTVTDQQGAVLAGAAVKIRSPALIGGSWTQQTNPRGQLRFPTLPPGVYTLDISFKGFKSYHEEGIEVGAGSTTDRRIPLPVEGVSELVEVAPARSRLDARNPGFGTRWELEDLQGMPMRRASMFDPIRATPGLSPTSPSASAAGGATATSVSAHGSGTNENMFVVDDTNTTCPCNGVSRSEPGVDFIQEIHVQSIGASAEYGNVQGAVINVIMRQGSDRFSLGTSYYGQTASLTSQPILRPYGTGEHESGYERVKYHDFTATLGGPVVRNRVWFFGGYQRVRDYDSQPGADPMFPRTYEQDKTLVKVTWKLATNWRLEQSLHYESWVSPEQPTVVKPFESTQRRHATVPVITFGNLTHVVSDRTIWEVRVGRFVHARVDDPSSGDRTIPSHFDQTTKIWSGGPSQLGTLTLKRTSAKTILTTYRPGFWGADHQWKIGGQFERGESNGLDRDSDRQEVHRSSRSRSPSGRHAGSFAEWRIVADVFGVRDRSGDVAESADGVLSVCDSTTVAPSARICRPSTATGTKQAPSFKARVTLYTWNVVSPRLGVTMKLTSDGRTMLRGSYGRFSQGVLTGEFSSYHPGATAVTTSELGMRRRACTRLRPRVVDPKVNVLLDHGISTPHTDEFSAGLDREIGARLSVSAVYVHKRGGNFIGWTDVGGQYVDKVWTAGGYTVPVHDLVNSTSDRRFLLSNPDGYSLTYHGVVLAAEKRRSRGWQAFGSYTWSRTQGLQASSGATAGAPQSSSGGASNRANWARSQ